MKKTESIMSPIVNELKTETVTPEPMKMTLDEFLKAHSPDSKEMRGGEMWIVDMAGIATDDRRKLWNLADYIVGTVSCDRAYLARRKAGVEPDQATLRQGR